jgi:hypothetical protein
MEGDMSTAGLIHPLGAGAPAPDAQRVAAIRAAMTADAEAGAGFAEGPRAALAALVDRAVATAHAAPHAEAAALLGHVRDRLAGLDPARLEPRSGLAGLFDSRGKRLKAFRAAYGATAEALASASADIRDRATAMERRDAELEALWSETREALADIDAHIAAARGWMSDGPDTPADPVPPEAAAAFEDTAATDADADPPVEAQADADLPVEAQADAEARATETGAGGVAPAPAAEAATEDVLPVATLTTLPHPLEARLETLLALRARAVARLPLIRAAQNADHAVPAALNSARDGIDVWSGEWRDALGLVGKRPRSVRPDIAALNANRDTLMTRLSASEAAVAAARARLAELQPRVADAVLEDRAAA